MERAWSLPIPTPQGPPEVQDSSPSPHSIPTTKEEVPVARGVGPEVPSKREIPFTPSWQDQVNFYTYTLKVFKYIIVHFSSAGLPPEVTSTEAGVLMVLSSIDEAVGAGLPLPLHLGSREHRQRHRLHQKRNIAGSRAL